MQLASKKLFWGLGLIFNVFCLFCFSNLLIAATLSCSFDNVLSNVGKRPSAIVMGLVRSHRSALRVTVASSENNNWVPIRFKVFKEDLMNVERYCTAKGDKRPSFMTGKYHVCRSIDILTERKKFFLERTIIPKAIKLHVDRLFVQRTIGRIFVPNYTDGVCSFFTVPRAHNTEGVEGADVVLYVAAGLGAGKAGAWAVYCSKEHWSSRPVIGVALFNPVYISQSEFFARLAAHEIAHVLGFELQLFISQRMITVVGSMGEKTRVIWVNTSKTLSKARAHYNCSTISGMRLENEGGGGVMGSHWELRDAKDEMMSGISGIRYYTSLTMALFEDLGFYRANWSMAETMAWGKNTGCRFLEENCVTNGKSNFPDMFCTNWDSFQVELRCTSDRFGLGFCGGAVHKNASLQRSMYSKNKNIAFNGYLTDNCAYIYPGRNSFCNRKPYLPGSRTGPNSRCLKGDELQYNGIPVGDVCAEIECGDGTVRVRYYGNDTWIDCPYGKAIRPQGKFTGGTIVCPKYYEVCLEVGADKSPVNLSPPMSVDVFCNEDNGRPRDSVTSGVNWSFECSTAKPENVTSTRYIKNTTVINIGGVDNAHGLYAFFLFFFFFFFYYTGFYSQLMINVQAC